MGVDLTTNPWVDFNQLCNALVAACAYANEESRELVKALTIDAMARHGVAVKYAQGNPLAIYEQQRTEQEIRALVSLALLMGVERPSGREVDLHITALEAKAKQTAEQVRRMGILRPN